MLLSLSARFASPPLPLIRNARTRHGSSIMINCRLRNCGSLIPRPSLLKTIECSSQGAGRRDEYGGGGRGGKGEETEEFERLFSNLNQVTLKRDPGRCWYTSHPCSDTGIWVSCLLNDLCILLALHGVNGNADAWETGSSGCLNLSQRSTFYCRWESALLFTSVFGSICYFGSQRFIGAVNGILVFGILISFTTLVVLAGSDIQLNSLLKFHLEAIPQSIPVIALAFVYQNVVPVLCTNLEGNLSKVRIAIVLGTAIPLVLFLIWDAVVLGTVPNFDASNSGFLDPLQQLRSNNGLIGPVVELFSFLAIGTSYIGFVLGLSDFVSDLLKQPAGQNRPLPYLLTIFPPLVLAFLDPEIFFRALDFAGTYGVLVLFGVLPAAMSWSERYNRASSSLMASPLVPGGKLTLSFVAGGAGWVILSEILANFS